MSENLDLVRSIYTTWERGDFASTAWAHPEIQLVVADGPMPGAWKGLAELGEAGHEWTDAWAGFQAVAEEYRELDADRVLVLIRRSGRGKTSGMELEQMRTEGASLFRIRDGKVIGIVNYFDRKRALADLDLAE
jgi:ketosteroid isomerase-like protein